MAKIKPNTSNAVKKGRKSKSLEELEAEISSKKHSIKTIVESGKWMKLLELEPLISKAMAAEMGLNHTRFVTNLRNPVNFSIKHINRFAFYIGTDPNIICHKVNEEIKQNKEFKKLTTFRRIADIPPYSKNSSK